MRSNNSFKPNLLRYGNGVADKACHAIASTTQVGLTQALGGKPTSGATVIRALLTLIAFLVTLPVIGVMTFFAVIFLAGPHGGVLPQWTEPVVLILGWSVVIVFPTLVARKVWLRTGKAK